MSHTHPKNISIQADRHQHILKLNVCKHLLLYIFSTMKQTHEKKLSLAKAFRLKPQQYLSNTFYKRGTTFFNAQVQELNADAFRNTDTFSKTKNTRPFLLKGGHSPIHNEVDRIKRRKGSGSKEKGFRIQKSPYISNTTEIQKMLRLLVPVRGPNQSLKLQIKRHNQHNLRNAELLIVKKSQNFQERMKAYSNRMGLPEDTKIFTMNSRDIHIKAALIRRGWVESSQRQTILFHLKWVYKDDTHDYHMLQQGQLYNHFRNNQELTNKNSLRKNIKKAKVQQRPNFPLSFDVELNDDNLSFQQAYVKFEAFKLLNNIGKYLSNRYISLSKKMERTSLYYNNHSTRPSQHLIDRVLPILYTRPQAQIKLDKNGYFESHCNFFQYVSYLAEEISKERKVFYSIFKSKKENRDVMKIIKKVQEQFFLGAQFLFKDLSPFYIVQILKMWHHAQQMFNSYGVENMWIVKPTGVSRGSGITITNDCSKIMQLRYGRIVQKYIEYPLLLDCKRKFDLRQWVLVTSFYPLKAYAFKHCYARFSSVKYSNDKYQNIQKHLTNYSQNKESYLRQKLHIKDNISKASFQGSAMAEEQLSQKIGERWTDIKRQFYADIVKTLNCCKSEIVQKQSCFEVYGFDVLIDQDYRPYILEVNLSPACQEREFLHQYLQQMADGVVNMIEGGQPTGWIQLSQQTIDCGRSRKDLEQKVKRIQNWWRNKRKMMHSREMVITEL